MATDTTWNQATPDQPHSCGTMAEYSRQHDAYFCPACDVWLSPACACDCEDHKDCAFDCGIRPDSPSDKPMTHFEKSIELLRRLHAETELHGNESASADGIRDQLDEFWYQLTGEECDLWRQESERLLVEREKTDG